MSFRLNRPFRWSPSRRARHHERKSGGAIGIVVLAALLGACGDGATDPTGASSAETTVETTQMSKPSVTVPTGPAPSTLVKDDLVVGAGAEAVKGAMVSVQYVGVHYSDGTQFDASWDRGQPFEFRLGAGQVIAGWDQGVEGMKVGGRRQLVIPANLGYGAQGSPPVIQPNETLVFVVDLLAVA